MSPVGEPRRWLRAHPVVGAAAEVCVFGRFDRQQVRVNWVARNPDAPLVDDAHLEAAWQHRLAEAEQAGRVLYPGPLCRLERAEVVNAELRLDLSPTDYREFVGTNLALANTRRTPEERHRFANPLGVSIALTTADGRLLLLRRSRQVAELPRMLHVVGGNVEPTDRGPVDQVDVFQAAERETAEEAGVEPDEVERLTCLGLARARRTYKPELIFAAALRIDSPEVVVRFARRPGPEHDELILIEADAAVVLDFLLRHAEEIVPAARACLVMYAFASAKSPTA